jgi:hypothetical protein
VELAKKRAKKAKADNINKPSKESLQIHHTRDGSVPQRGTVVQPTPTAAKTFK